MCTNAEAKQFLFKQKDVKQILLSMLWEVSPCLFLMLIKDLLF